MRALRFAIFAVGVLAACSSSSHNMSTPDATGGGGGDAPGTPADARTTPGFTVTTPDIAIPAGKEITYCYYFHTPNTADVIVKNWQSQMTPGSHHLIVYFTSTAQMPDGTLDPTGECGGVSGGGQGLGDLPVWTYSAQTETAEADMPPDDGSGKPVGMKVPANQAAVVQLHYLNATDNTLMVHATITANGYDAGTAYTAAAAYITYNYSLDIPAGAMNQVFTETCATPAGANFFSLSTHSHKQTVKDTVMDGASMVLETDDWSVPTIKTWTAMPFYKFTSGLTYSCTYDNPGSTAIVAGPSAQTNEMCMAVGYFFPATNGPVTCLDNTVL